MAKTKTKAKKKKRPTGKKWRALSGGQKAARLTLWALICLVGMMLIGLLAGFFYYQNTAIPDPNQDFTTSTTTIYYRDGTTVLGRLSVQNRTPLAYADMPQTMKDAVVAAEDRTFWTNQGVSVTGIIRAAWNIARGGSLQSGSTITQQYVKTLYLTNAQTASRKVKEMVLSIKMTNSMSKEDILEGYLNTVYFGRGAYGIQAAAKAYFDTDAKNLTVAQAAVLTSLLRGPAIYDPADEDNLPRLLDRYNYVLDGMVEMGTLTQGAEDQIRGTLPDFPQIKSSQTYGGPKGYLLKMVESELQQTVGLSSAEVAGGGLSVITTFDANMQAAAVASAQKYTAQAADKARKPQDPAQLHAAIASVSVGTGEVLALYGGPDFVANNLNWATRHRMTGSTFKPFAFIAGERNGMTLNTPLNGNPITVNGTTIHNDGNARYGTVNLLRATQNSVNTAFVDLVTQLPGDGPSQVIKAAQDAGATMDDKSWQPVPVIALGTAEVSPLDMANAYATFDNNGVAVSAHVVMEVKDADGVVRYQATPDKAQTISPGICADLVYALQSVVDSGTGVAARALNYPAAGKTGTAGMSGGGTGAAWFVGFTKQISTAVMFVAGDQGVSNLDPYAPRGSSSFFGGGYPAQTWADYMKAAMKGMPKQSFAPPSTNVTATPSDTPTPEQTPSDWADEPSSGSTPTVSPPTGTTTTPSSSPPSSPPTSATPSAPPSAPSGTPSG